MSYNEINSRWF